MSLPVAYCTEADEVMNIVRASEYYFSQPKPLKRLSFLCPDEQCRRATGQVVSGVNYDNLPNVDNLIKSKSPHYRLIKPTNHLQECPWIDVTEAIDEFDAECPAEKQIKNLKRSELIDVFNPLINEDVPRINIAYIENIARLPTKHARIDAYKRYLQDTPNVTSLLQRVADCFKAIDKEELPLATLNIEGVGVGTYRNYFTSAEFCRQSVNARKIYYGPVKVSQRDDGFTLTFSKTSTFDNGFVVPVNVFVSNDIIAVYRGRGVILATLLAAKEMNGYPIFCCAFGAVSLVQVDDEPQLNIDIANLNFLSLHFQ